MLYTDVSVFLVAMLLAKYSYEVQNSLLLGFLIC